MWKDPDAPDSVAAYPPGRASWRERLYIIIFRHDTRLGRAFDVALLWAIVLSVISVTLESVEAYREHYAVFFWGFEWTLTALFTVEYLLRLVTARSALRYATSFFGVVDLLSLLPTYLATLEGAQSLLVIRSLRLLRVFRILRLGSFIREAAVLMRAIRGASYKISVFLSMVLCIALIMGALMYLVEGPTNGFTSIPRAMYWAIVTVTTVGFGDITPRTALGQALASVVMIVGYSVIAVPTGLVTAELTGRARAPDNFVRCERCGRGEHADDAIFCRICGASLPD